VRDPLHFASVRSKLALLFVGLFLIAYGLGGFLGSRWEVSALHDEILARLDSQCSTSLSLLERRAEDFASDGYIRDRVARLASGSEGAESGRWRDELARHLARNKLPLEPAFENLAVADGGGRLLVAVHDDAARRLSIPDRGPVATGKGASTDVTLRTGGEPAGIVLTKALRDLDGEREVGQLAVLLFAEDWIQAVLAHEASGIAPPGEEVQLIVHDPSGRRVVLSAGPAGIVGPLRMLEGGASDAVGGSGYAPTRGRYARAFPIADGGWAVEVALGVEEALAPVSGLRSRLLGVGVGLAALSTLLLFFPMRFVVRPLMTLTRAAERLREGELDTRVAVSSEDEIGELGRAFNGMAEAIRERTGRLETTASDLRERQRELRAERDRLDAVIASMHDGLVVLDGEGRVVMSNAAARPLLDLVHRGELAQSRHVCRDQQRRADGGEADGPPREAEPGEARGPRTSGGSDCFACLLDPVGPPRSCMLDVGPRTFEVHTTPLPPTEGGGRGRVLVSRDLTDRIQQDEREIHNERLAVLGEVAAVVAHELNNPLASISMFGQMLADELPAESPLRENTDVIRRNTETAKRTIRELLDYATGASPEVGAIDVHAVLEDVARFLRPLSERAGVTVTLDAAAERQEVSGDEVQLRQVFVNLALNAIQAVSGRSLAPGSGTREHPPGAVVLSTRNEGERLVVDVRDTGPGIAPEHREQIFRPFFTTKSRGEGTGLGLSTARRIAEMHGGGLDLVESSPSGTVFSVRLRVRAPEEAVT